MKADEGFKLEVIQVVSFQIENCQTIERSQSIGVYLGDVVVAQLEHLDKQTMFQMEKFSSEIRFHTASKNSFYSMLKCLFFLLLATQFYTTKRLLIVKSNFPDLSRNFN